MHLPSLYPNFLLVILNVVYSTAEYFYQTKYFNTTLDHFNFVSNKTFPLRYLENNTYWKPKEGAPIFFYTGNEGDIKMFAENTGFMWEIAAEFDALVVFAEHRYYGSSLPFGNLSFTDPKYSGYLSSSQALADFVALVDHIKTSYNLPKDSNPVIAFGGSYGGMLAAWIRIKYPSTFIGSIAASAPIWQFTGMTPCNAFSRVTSSVFYSVAEDCATNIKNSWAALTDTAKTEEGLRWLSSVFRLCRPLTAVSQLKDWISEVVTNLAMTNYPYPTNFLYPLPANPVKAFCKHLLNEETNKEQLIKKIFKGVSVYFNQTGEAKCLDMNETASPELGLLGWAYQSCTEMVMPMCDDGSDMFEQSEWNLEKVSQDCYERFKVRPQAELVRQEYGGKNIHWLSNIVFSNGLLDPWSSGGVVANLSKTAVAVILPDAAHHLDLRAADQADPICVRAARKLHRRNIRSWISHHRKSYDALRD